MWNRQLLKQNAKTAFMRNYWGCVLVSMLIMILSGSLLSYGNTGSSKQYTSEVYVDYDAETIMKELDQLMIELETFLIRYWNVILMAVLITFVVLLGVVIVFYNVLSVGLSRYFLENREHKTSAWQLFYNFKGGRYSSSVWVMFLRTIYILGWTLLFVIPGIIKSYSYMMVPYILAENASMDSKRVLQLSKEMMYGHKLEAFKLELSFFGWMLLSSFTGGILNIFYVNPYMHATYAEFYCAIKADARRKGILQQDELPTRLVEQEATHA